MNELEAKQMIEDVGKWLYDNRTNDLYNNKYHDLAREFALSLLEDACVEDLGGCPLCTG